MDDRKELSKPSVSPGGPIVTLIKTLLYCSGAMDDQNDDPDREIIPTDSRLAPASVPRGTLKPSGALPTYPGIRAPFPKAIPAGSKIRNPGAHRLTYPLTDDR